jgi:hypothetical protein
MNAIINVMDIAELPAHEMLSILRQGSVLRLPHLEGRLRQAKEHVRHFEAKYGMTIDQLVEQGLPDDANYQVHEDFIEWEYWNDVLGETDIIIKNVKRILSKAEEASVLH